MYDGDLTEAHVPVGAPYTAAHRKYTKLEAQSVGKGARPDRRQVTFLPCAHFLYNIRKEIISTKFTSWG